jgi:thiol-disulfide isomerase/thioredoxin
MSDRNMSQLSRILLLPAAAVVFAAFAASAQEQPAAPKVELRAVKYDALKALIRSQRGKVVVVDVWADFCPPCKQAFPYMLQMQRRHANDGLVCMSATVDRAEARDAALKFLQEKNATIANYWIDEKETFWQDKFDTGGPPVVFVFDRQGRRAAKFDNNDPDKPFDHTDVEKLVAKLLQGP